MVSALSVVLSLGTCRQLINIAANSLNEPPPSLSRVTSPLSYAYDTVRHLDLRSSDVRGSDFRGATIRDSDFQDARLDTSSFRGATLDRVNLSGAELCAADFRGADLRGAVGLDSVRDWSYVFYDKKTKWPTSFVIEAIPGPIEETFRDLLYTCSGDNTGLLPISPEE